MLARSSSQATPKPLIVLDGPSALTMYRDRDDRLQLEEDTEYESVDGPDDVLWIGDDPVPLAELNVLGARCEPATSERTSAIDDTLSRTRATDLSRCSTRSREIKAVKFDELGIRPPEQGSPLYLLIPNAAARRRVQNVRQRILGSSIPRDAFKKLGECVLVPTPEFCFLLLACHVELVELIRLGMELCGHYRLVGGPTNNLAQSNRTIYNCDALTTPDRLRAFVESMNGFPGRTRALKACQHIASGACSPMETNVYLLLCLPSHLGGYALPKPILNAKRPVNRDAASFTLSHTLIPDLYWTSARLDIEYDSDEFHADSESLRKGARRTLALRAMHIDVMSLTYDMVCDERAFESIARLIARRVGKRLVLSKAAQAKRHQLRRIVLSQDTGNRSQA